MARKSRKNMPVAVAEPTDNLTAKAVLSMDKEAKPYQVGIYARLSFESEANKERDTVDTQIAYIREFINSQDDMVEVEVYADISVTGTTFERPEFDRMIQDIRAGRINTVITRDLSRLGRNYVEAGNYIERVFPFLDVRYIAITDDFDTARPGTDLSVPLKNIVNEYYSKDLSKKVETGKHSIWAQGGFSEGTPPYGYYRATDGSRKLLIDEEVSDNVVRIFNMFLDGEGYGRIAKTMQSEGILSPPKYRFYKAGKTEFAEKAREWQSDLSEEQYMTIDAQQESEREAEEQRDWEENYLRDRIQAETGNEILTLDGVLEKFNELLDRLYTEIYDELYFNPCFSISQQYAIEEKINEQILFKVQSNAVQESEIEVVVSLWLDGAMDSDSSATISCRKTNEKDKNLFKAEIRYHNGSGYEDYDLGGIYLDSESELDGSELNDFKKELMVYIEEELNPMVKKLAVYNKTNEDKKPVSDEVCYECEKKGISVTKDFYPEGFCCFCGTDNNE